MKFPIFMPLFLSSKTSAFRSWLTWQCQKCLNIALSILNILSANIDKKNLFVNHVISSECTLKRASSLKVRSTKVDLVENKLQDLILICRHSNTKQKIKNCKNIFWCCNFLLCFIIFLILYAWENFRFFNLLHFLPKFQPLTSNLHHLYEH